MKYTGAFPFHGYTTTITHDEYIDLLDAVRLNKLIVIRTVCGLHVPTITQASLSSETIGESNEEDIRMITYSAYEENYTGLSLFDIAISGVQNEDGTHTVRFQLHLNAYSNGDEADFNNLSVLATKNIDTIILRKITNENTRYKDFFCGGSIVDEKQEEDNNAEVVINNFGYGGIPLRSFIVSQSEEKFDSNTTGDAAANIHNQLITGINLIPYFDLLQDNTTAEIEAYSIYRVYELCIKLLDQNVKTLFVTTKTGVNIASINVVHNEENVETSTTESYELHIYYKEDIKSNSYIELTISDTADTGGTITLATHTS